MIKLKPCPFCGGKAELFTEYEIFFKIQCVVCGCGTLNGTSKPLVIERWNRRTTDDD